MKGKVFIFMVICMSALLLFSQPLTGRIKGVKDWQYFHGPQGDNISKETGLLKKWPENGPPLIGQPQGWERVTALWLLPVK